MTETAEIETERDKLRNYLFDVGGRLDKVLAAAAPVLPKVKITHQQAITALCDDNSPEGLKSLARLLADLDPLIGFLETELLPALTDGANDLDTIVKREAIDRKEEPKNEELKSEPPKPADQKEIPKKKSDK